MGYHDKPHDNSEKWLQSLEYKTALLGATKYNTKLYPAAWNNHPFWKPFIEHLIWFKHFHVGNGIALSSFRS